MAIAGGLLLAVSWFFDPSGLVGAAGAALFLLGILWFLGLAYRDGRREGFTFGRSLRRSASDALRLAWLLMP